MSESPEAVVRKFLAAFAEPNVDELVSFFSDDAVFLDGPRGVHRGVDAIRSGNVKIDVHSLVADGGTVVMEGTENYLIGGKHFTLDVMGAFQVDDDSRIKRWRYSYDLKSVTDQIEAAGFKAPS